jgi:hypothetical protein
MDSETTKLPLADPSTRVAKHKRAPSWIPTVKITKNELAAFRALPVDAMFDVCVNAEYCDPVMVEFHRAPKPTDDSKPWISYAFGGGGWLEENEESFVVHDTVCALNMETGELLVHDNLCAEGVPIMGSEDPCIRCGLHIDHAPCVEVHGFACGWTLKCTECGVLVDTLDEDTHFHQYDFDCPHCYNDCFSMSDGPDEPDEDIPRCKKCNAQTKCYKPADE